MKKKLSLLMIVFMTVAAFAIQVGKRATATTWTVAGSSTELFGSSWDPTAAANDMTLDGDVYKWEKTGVTLAAGTVEFKVCGDHAWGTAFPAENYKLVIAEAGIYTVTITFNATTEEINAVPTKTGDAVVEDKIVLAGTFNEWSQEAKMTKTADKLEWTAEIDGTEITEDIEFKLIVNGGWKGPGSAVKINAPEGWVSGTDNWVLKHTESRYLTYSVTATCAGSVATESDWTITIAGKTPRTKDVTISPASDDIAKAFEAELGNNFAKNVTINLTKDVTYTLSKTIKAGGNVTINGNGATIDASTGDNIVGIEGVTEFAKKADDTNSELYLVNAITFKDVTIKGMKKALVRDLMTKTLLETLTIDNCVMQVSNAKPVIDFDGRGYVGKVVVKSSTIWAAAPTEKNFAKYGSKPADINEALKQEFDVQNSTIVNIAAKPDFSGGTNLNNTKLQGKATNVYTLKNNIFVNCGKSGQVVVGFNGGQTSATPAWDVDKNSFNWNGADVAAAEVTKAGQKDGADIVKNIVAGVVAFKDAANGDFTLGDCAQKTAGIGDPRWVYYDITVATTVANGTVTVDKEKANKGETVTITATPEEGYFLESLAVNCVNIDEKVTVTNGKFTMPADAVVINAVFKKYVDVTLSAEDITGNINEALSGKVAASEALRNVIINLAANTTYTVTAPIVAGGDVFINGGEGTTIDASGNEGDIITLNGSIVPFAKKSDNTDSDHRFVSNVSIEGVKITGIKGALVTDAQKTLVHTLTIYDAVIEMPAAAKNVLNFNGKGYVGRVAVMNSTIYAKGGNNTGFFAQYGSRPKNVNGDWLQEFDFENSTIVGIANGKNFCDLKQNGTAQNVYTLKNNIFVDCGKNGQVVVGFNKGQASATSVWTVDGNSFNITTDGALTDNSAAEIEKAGKVGEADIVKNSVAGAVVFADAANGDFTLGDCAQYPAKIGDPRWISTKTPADVTIAATDIEGGNLTAAITAAAAKLAYNQVVGNLTITLTKDVAYTVTAPIVAAGNVTINGNGATIDASGNAGDILTLDGTIALAKKADGTDSDHKLIASVTIEGVKITGIKGALVTDAQKTLVETVTISDAVIEMPAAAKNVLNFANKGYVGKAVVKNSTIYAKGGNNTGFFAQYGSRPKNVNGDWLQEFDFENSTIVGIANGKNFCDLKQNGTAQNVYTLKNNIFVDCGKNGQVVVGFNKGQASATSVWTVDGNSFNITTDGALTDNSAAEIEKAGKKDEADIVKNCVAGAVIFKDAANGEFTLGDCAQKTAEIGDPRWLVDPTSINTVKTKDSIDDDNAPMYNLSGQRVDKGYKGVVIKNGKKYFNK